MHDRDGLGVPVAVEVPGGPLGDLVGCSRAVQGVGDADGVGGRSGAGCRGRGGGGSGGAGLEQAREGDDRGGRGGDGEPVGRPGVGVCEVREVRGGGGLHARRLLWGWCGGFPASCHTSQGDGTVGVRLVGERVPRRT